MGQDIYVIQAESIFATRAAVFLLLESGVTDTRVLSTLLSGGTKWDEPDLWDFKSSLPWMAPGVRHSDSFKVEHDAKIDEIVKDAVAFYNSFGGYVIAGIDDGNRSILGFDKRFDVESLNQRIRSATGQSVECIYRTLDWHNEKDESFRLGLLFIPRRQATTLPIQFRTDARKSSVGKHAFRNGEFYLRQRDECRPARSAEDYAFLYSENRRKVHQATITEAALLENNLPDRDGELGKFIGREADMSSLWEWLADKFSPVRLICGLGGVGKTSLAYHFSELFAYARPAQFDKLVWLGAKKQNWLASRDRYESPSRIDFFDVGGFLEKLAIELGCPEAKVAEASDRQNLMELIVEQLEAFKFLVVVDDVDTLEDAEQQSIYHLVSTIFARAKSKALMTARRNLGMPRGQYIELTGLKKDDFQEFVATKCRLLNIPFPATLNEGHREALFKTSGGSPLFVISLLRLISLGVPVSTALNQWRGAVGEKVRDAAFSKEVSRLKPAEARVLLAAIYLRETSSVELAAVVKASAFEISNCLDKLRDFSMIELASELPGGATIIIPRTLTMMVGVVEARVTDFQALKTACAEQRRLHKDPTPFVREAIRRCMANLKNENAPGAVEVAEAALEVLPEHPDLLCMMARCKLELGGEHRREAINLFRSADTKGCRRGELFEFWIRALQDDNDWSNVIEVSKNAEVKISSLGRFSVPRAHAYVALGDNFLRANRYSDAERTFLEGAQDIKRVLSVGVAPIYRSDAKQEQKSLVRKWLLAVSLQCPSNSDYGRLLGAALKALKEYGWLDVTILERAVTMGRTNLLALMERRTISTGTYETIERNLRRFGSLRKEIERVPSTENLTKALVEVEMLAQSVLDRVNKPASEQE